MKEDIEEKTVRLAISSARLTGQVLLEGLRIYLRVPANIIFQTTIYGNISSVIKWRMNCCGFRS